MYIIYILQLWFGSDVVRGAWNHTPPPPPKFFYYNVKKSLFDFICN